MSLVILLSLLSEVFFNVNKCGGATNFIITAVSKSHEEIFSKEEGARTNFS